MAKVFIINIALVRGPATIQAGMQYDDKARARRVFDGLVQQWKSDAAFAAEPVSFEHDLGATVFCISEIATLAFIEHDPNPPPAGFPDVQMPTPGGVQATPANQSETLPGLPG